MNRYNYYSEKAVLEHEFLSYFKENSGQITNLYVEKGLDQLCEYFNFTFEWQKELLFDFIAFETDAIYLTVNKSTDILLALIKDGKGAFIKRIFNLQHKKYQSIWQNVLKILNQEFTDYYLEQKSKNLNALDFFVKAQNHFKKYNN